MTTVHDRLRVRRPLPRTSVPDTVRVAATALAPTIARGVLARRPAAVALAERFDADRRAGRLLRRLRTRYGSGPLRLRVPGRSLALVLSATDVERALTGTPTPFSAAAWEKQAALGQFEPNGVLASTGPERADRRRFNEDVLDTPETVHDLAESFATVVEEEAAILLGRVARTGGLAWPEFRIVWWRVIRRVVLGDAARDDSEVSDMLTRLRMHANWGPAWPRRDALRRRFRTRVQSYLDAAEPGSLAAAAARAPVTDRTDPADQMPQWLFAFEPAGMAAFRALGLLATHPEQAERAHAEAAEDGLDLPYLRACVQEAVRLWPTTLVLLRESTTETEWEDGVLPAGTGLIMLTPFLQRDEERLPYADVFTPRIWLDGTAQANWSLMPFSGGPAECPGRNLVLLVTSLFLARLLRSHEYRQAAGRSLAPDRPLPRTQSPFRLRLRARPWSATTSPWTSFAGP
ncbi:MAG: cytochrome P450 [Streptosporangiales bacterium]|nr:cytochrome P450 [Streptosporangiales bacterium]